MSLPQPDPSLPGGAAPLFGDTDAARGDHMRANNQAIWEDLQYLDDGKNINDAAAATPDDADRAGFFQIAGAVIKYVTFANLFLWIITKVAALASKTTPVDADSVLLIDSEASNVGKRLTLTNLKAFLKTYFDTLYMSITGPTYITQQATATRVTGSAPDALGEYRSYLRNAAARTYTETNSAPSAAPSASNGYLLYTVAAFSSADPANSPSRYEIFIGIGKNPRVEFYRNTGRTGQIFVDLASQYGNSAANVGITWNYDPTTGIVQVFHPINQAANNYIGCDENYNLLTGNVYFDIKC